MTDIVKRIRLHWPDMTFELAEEAADEIESLRFQLNGVIRMRNKTAAEIERLRVENDLLANDRDGYVALLTAQNNKLRAALTDIRDHSLELYATGVARAALAEEKKR